MKVLLVILVTLTYSASQVNAISGRECKLQEECNDGECCAIPPLYPVMSKRMNILPTPKQKIGHCMTYLPVGSTCDPISQLNGLHCGCAKDLHCNFYPDKFGKRKLLPGKRICEAKKMLN
ncbi:hypothetical protein SNE40_007201 [Patella caerulea]|uniref:Uncharacterized protein n=1 Tax=Patella caerulea TaxID=87958 RepID=A0AAN8PTF0_PATCE